MAEHGGATRYRDGCRCDLCRRGNAERQRTRRARDVNAHARVAANPTNVVEIKSKPTDPQPKTMGANEIAWLEQVELSGRAEQLPVIVSQGATLSRILDNPEMAPMHATVSRQLDALYARLQGPKKKSGGRLASISAMTTYSPRRQAQ